MKKKLILELAFAAALGLSILAQASQAEININIGINAPLPSIVISSPPAVVVIPGTYVYIAPDLDEDIFFFRGYWYRPHKERWYRASDYNGSWIVISKVPSALMELPPDYRRVSRGHEHIPYGQVKKNWKKWEEEKRWESHERKWQNEDRRDYRDHKEHRGKGKGKHDD